VHVQNEKGENEMSKLKSILNRIGETVPLSTLSVKIPDALRSRLNNACQRASVDRAEVVSAAIEEAVESIEVKLAGG